ncbi:type IV toxin-antitoxin system AbiEi family antitoxin domain-containing protein [Nocardia sp. R16R-3T]
MTCDTEFERSLVDMVGDAAGRALDSAERGWRVLRRLAGRHAGFFTTRQALRVGCETRVRAGLGDGTVSRAGVGLLRLADWPAGPLDEYAMWAAWFDGAAAVSHQSAAELHGLGSLRPRFLHMSVGAGRPPLTPRLVVQRRPLVPADLESAGAFLVTTPVRTVLDLAESDIGQSALDEVVADAVAIHRCASDEIRSASVRLPPRAAVRVYRALTAV